MTEEKKQELIESLNSWATAIERTKNLPSHAHARRELANEAQTL